MLWSLVYLEDALAEGSRGRGASGGRDGLSSFAGWEFGDHVSGSAVAIEEANVRHRDASRKLFAAAQLYADVGLWVQARGVNTSWLQACVFKPREIASVTWAAVHLRRDSQKLLEASEQLLLSYRQPVPLPELVQCAYATAQADFTAPALFAHLARRLADAGESAEQMTDRDCVMALWACGR